MVNVKYLKIKYLRQGSAKLKPSINEDGNERIDVYAAVDTFFRLGDRELIPLGFALEMPKGYEAELLARSSTNKTWGIILTNGTGVIDNKYKGNNDEWMVSAYCNTLDVKEENKVYLHGKQVGVMVHAGDKIAQFRIRKCMPDIQFIEVDNLENEDRGGIGSTGMR